MLEGIALVAIVTAAVTSTFVARAAHLQEVAAANEEAARDARIESSLKELNQRLDRLETKLDSLTEQASGRYSLLPV
jgi:hypothetical protein